MDNIIDVHKTIYSPIGRFIVSEWPHLYTGQMIIWLMK